MSEDSDDCSAGMNKSYENNENEVSCSSDSHEESSDECNDEEDEEFDLIQELRTWALRYNITHAAFNSLLKRLKKVHPDLPIDSRTILKTIPHVEAEKKAGGLFILLFWIKKKLGDIYH